MTKARTDPRSRIGPALPGIRPLLGAVAAQLALTAAAMTPAPAMERIDEVSFASASLGREMKVRVVRPATGGECPVLLLLHGRGRHRDSLLELPDTRDALLAADLWVVLPDGEDGWYMNSPVETGARYADHLDEVVAQVSARHSLPTDSRRWAVAGWSMGAYGAVRFAQRRPERVGAVAAVIGLLDFPREETLPPGRNYTVPAARFGSDPEVWAANNPIRHVGRLRGKAILLITADEAFDRIMNENFSRALKSAAMPHEFVMLSGGHTLDVVRAALPSVLAFVRSTTAMPSTP